MEGLFSYIPGTSFLHRLNPLTKLIGAFFLCMAAAVSTAHLFILALTVALLALSATAGALRPCLKLVGGLGALALVVFVLQVLCVRDGAPLFWLGPLAITDVGVMGGLLVVLKVVCMVLPLTLAFMVTPLNDLTNALVSKAHLPYKYAFTITTAIRFIPVFADEMAGIMEAQKARGVRFDTRNPFKKVVLTVPLCVPLLVMSVKRTDSIAISAELRGFDLRTRTSGWKTYSFHTADMVTFVICVLVFAAVIGLNAI